MAVNDNDTLPGFVFKWNIEILIWKIFHSYKAENRVRHQFTSWWKQTYWWWTFKLSMTVRPVISQTRTSHTHSYGGSQRSSSAHLPCDDDEHLNYLSHANVSYGNSMIQMHSYLAMELIIVILLYDQQWHTVGFWRPGQEVKLVPLLLIFSTFKFQNGKKKSSHQFVFVHI